ncbi:MAG: hypothetical protein ACT4N2_12265 [Hyphomicrobium sp.]
MAATTATAADAGSADGPVAGPQPERIVFRAGRGRRIIFSFVLLILLPFFLSLPGMLYMRLKHGFVVDAFWLGIFAAAFAVIMFLILIELIFSVRTRIDLGAEKVKMTLPSGRGPTPIISYKTYEVPYDQVQTVETRREVYGGALVPVLLKGARLTLKDGSNIRLGYVSEANVDPSFPYPEIAKIIADRARLPLIDRGSFRRSVRSKFLGIKTARGGAGDTIDEAQIAELNRSHSNVILGLIGGLVVLMLLGLVDDFTTRTPVARGTPPKASAAAPVTTPAKPAPVKPPPATR